MRLLVVLAFRNLLRHKRRTLLTAAALAVYAAGASIPYAWGHGLRRARLVREGMLIPGRGHVRASLLQPPAGRAAKGRAVLGALLEERREGR